MAGLNWKDSWPGIISAMPEPRIFDGPIDPWAREVIEVFRSVINRPKSGLKSESFHQVPGIRGLCAPIEVVGTGEIINLFIHWSPQNLHVRATPDDFEQRFHFSGVISRRKPIKIRKLALVLCKKITQKSVYDVLNS